MWSMVRDPKINQHGQQSNAEKSWWSFDLLSQAWLYSLWEWHPRPCGNKASTYLIVTYSLYSMQDTQPEHTGQGSTMHGDTMKHLSPRSRDHCDMTIDNRLGFYYLRYNTARGGHIDVACRSICDWDQNGIKRSMFFLGANQGIKTNSERLISTDQRTFSDTLEAWLRF